MPWRRRIDVWGPVAALAGTGVFLLTGFEGALTRDPAVYAYAGQQVAEGVPPYVQILNRAGPLAHLVPGAGAALGDLIGTDDLLAMRVTMMVLSALALWAAYLLGRDLFRSSLAGVITSAALLSFQGFITYATAGPREKTTMLLLMLVALWAVSRRWWATAGAATAVATLTWQGSMVPLAAVIVVSVLALPGGSRPRLVALVRVAVAGLAVAAANVAYFIAVGAVAEFWEGFFTANATTGGHRGLVTMLADPRQLVTGFGWSLALVVAGLLGSLVVAATRLRTLDHDSPGDVAVAALAAGTLACLAWSLLSFEGWPDAFPFLPFAACGIAGAGHLLIASRPSVARRRVAGVAVALLFAGTALTAVVDRSAALVEQRRQDEAVLVALDDPELLAINDPAPLVLAGMRNPIRYQIFVGSQNGYIDATYPGGLPALAREVQNEEPTVITVFGRPPTWLQPVLADEYDRVGGRQKPYSWYFSTTWTTAEERATLRGVFRDTLPGDA